MNEDLRMAIADLQDALHFFEKVQHASLAERLAVGNDHIEWLEEASRKVIDEAYEQGFSPPSSAF